MDKLRAINLFVMTADTLSFSETGRRCGLSTASVSRRITELEDHLGVTLVHRSTRSLKLTEAGQSYVVQARDILASIEHADASVSALQDAPTGLLRIHARSMFGQTVLAPLQGEFAKNFPDLMVELHLSERPVQLRDEGFDIDFRIAPPQEPGLIRKRLFLSERILVASPNYLASAPPLATIEDLTHHSCLVYWLGSDPPYWRFKKDGRVEEVQAPSRFASNNGQVLLEAARAGHGVALLDDYTVARDIRDGRLQQLMPEYRITNSTFEEGIFATYLETQQVPVKIRVYMDFISDHLPQRLTRLP